MNENRSFADIVRPAAASIVLLAIATPLIAQERQRGAQQGDRLNRPSNAGEQREQPQKVIKTEREWRKILTREQYRVLRQKGTERPFRNKYDKHFEPGKYACAACGQQLFESTTKFNSGCGWPAFYAAKAGDRVILKPDYSLGMMRTEVLCARCDSHLGHVFRDAPQTPTGNRFCINSVALKFIPAEEKAAAKDDRASDHQDQKGSGTR